ncbi:hypothetical protein CAPTEDRAFT_213236 [Capitella teleta]|uniref:Major facilitator superfamily (MFS) profile domain-containing protein n=1 Tax=Capitella teleta TaxID=283909 RepID=R7UY23_CAPTE|nr:hypothetical protein CAPTEDRAFT_213236 [Capitella teleta]|eukprot:ELU08336.1 hypothetical protein CAPTEDRAFT_213236 [Capitella teleta]
MTEDPPLSSSLSSSFRHNTPTTILCAQSSAYSPPQDAIRKSFCETDEEQVHDSDVAINSERSTPIQEHLDEQPKPAFTDTRNGLTMVILCSSNVSSAMYGSLLAPFFPLEAAKKEVSGSTIVGFIFGCYPLVMFVFSPIFGQNMAKIGPKFLFIAGNFVCSGCAILFGLLQWCPPGSIFIGMCFILRLTEALAAAAKATAAIAIATYTFPDHISTVMGLLQASSCLGLMAGPPIGGVLYAAAGYYLPFAVTGGVFMLSCFVSIFVLPAMDESVRQQNGSPWWHAGRVLCSPLVIIIGSLVAVSQAAIGFIDVALALHIQDIRPGLSLVYIGLIFLVPGAIVVFTAPLYGWLADRYKGFARPAILLGGALGVIGFLGLGPSPLLSFLPSGKLWILIVSVAIAGLGWGSIILTYEQFVIAARDRGIPPNMQTQGVIAGINGSFSSLGAFIGPIMSGLVVDAIGFDWSATIFGGASSFCLVMLAVYTLVKGLRSYRQQDDSSRPLLAGDT